jgi:hypothetical protein
VNFELFFLNPVGHLGLTAVTVFVILPLAQKIVVLFFLFTFGAVGVGVGAASCERLTRINGEEYVKPLAERVSHPFFSRTKVVATLLSPSGLMIEIVA